MRTLRGARALACALALGAPGIAASAGAAPRAALVGDEQAARTLVAAVAAVCGPDVGEAERVAAALGGAVELDREPLLVQGHAVGARATFARRDGVRVRIERFTLAGELRRVVASWADPPAVGRRPRLVAVGDERCRVATGRRLRYYPDGRPRALEELGSRLREVVAREPLDPPVPPGPVVDGVSVALVDSGVNYLLDSIHRRLARDADGTPLGYDWSDLDHRPFDVAPSRSPFYPRHHGTRTASVLLAEAPVARLVPYRAPRDDMRRMGDLVAAAARAGVRVVDVSTVSERRADWTSFAAAARAHPRMLFVVAAGDDGRDIDARPVWPAALDLDNVLVTTAADASGLPARGSNWGRHSVDVAVPAAEVLVTDFHGRPRAAAGSSYAAARVAALAACLLGAHAGWGAPELRRAILARAEQPVAASLAYVAAGVVLDPTASARGACRAARTDVETAPPVVWGARELYPAGALPPHAHLLRPSLYVVSDAGWGLVDVYRATREMASIVARCGVAVPQATVTFLDVPRRMRYLRDDWSDELAARVSARKPAAFFVADTAQEPEFDAQAFGRSNAGRRRGLVDSVWITAPIPHPGIGLAHELYHVLADSGAHSDDPGNLMYARTGAGNTALTDAQCARMVRAGEAHGLLEPAPPAR